MALPSGTVGSRYLPLVSTAHAFRDDVKHTELWQTLHAPQDPEPLDVGGLVRRPRRTEARPLVDLSDFQSAELSDFGPALTFAERVVQYLCKAHPGCPAFRSICRTYLPN